MGRQAPNPQYQIINCDVQTASGSYSGYSPGILPQLNYNFQTLLPIGSSGSGSTGTIAIGSGIGNYVPYFNGCLVGVNDEERAIVDSTQATYFDSDDDLRYEPWFSYRFYTTYLSGATQGSGLYALKITGASVQKQQTLTGYLGGGVEVKQIFDYTDLDSNYSLITTFVNSRTQASGGAVSLEIIQHTTTGVTQVTGLIIRDTLNAGSAITNLGFPSISKDLSYTGATQRYLVGYQATTGVTSGQLCAVLVEISGTTMTTGTPVVIRSVVSSGTVGQFISTTYHSGVDSNCFVITTAVSPASAVTGYSTSGQIIGAKPPSGLVLAGSFGTAVTGILTTGELFQPLCTALNTFTGSTSHGVMVGVTGTTANYFPLEACLQMYTVSGAVTPVITTGVYSQLRAVLDTSGSPVGTQFFQAYARVAAVNFNPPRLIEISSKVTTSGLISYTAYYGINTNATSGVALINHVHVPYSLSSTGKTQYITLTGSITTESTANRTPSNLFFNLPTNPYNGVHGSFIFLNARMTTSETAPLGTGIGLGTLVTTTGYFPSGIATTASSYFGGSFFQGINRTAGSILYTSPGGMRFRSFYAVTSGNSNSVPFLPTVSGGFNSANSLTPVRFKGTYPNYTGMVALQSDIIYDISFSSITGQQQYNLLKDTFKTPISNGDGISNRMTYINRKPESVGIVVNPSGLITSGTGIINSGSVLNGTVLVKTALTEEAKRALLRDCVKSYIIAENRNVFE